MSLPRVVGTDGDGVEITAQNGRYGPYLKKGTDSRSLDRRRTRSSRSPWTRPEAIYAQPKQRGRAAAKPPLKELGPDPVSGRPMVIKDGRFGAYVTDGEVNATLRRGDDRRDDHRRAGRRAAGREAGQGSGAEEAPGEEGGRQEGGQQRGGGHSRRRRPRRPPPRRPPPKAASRAAPTDRDPQQLAHIATRYGVSTPPSRCTASMLQVGAIPAWPGQPEQGAGSWEDSPWPRAGADKSKAGKAAAAARAGRHRRRSRQAPSRPAPRPAVLRPALQRRRPAADQPRPRAAQPGRPGRPQRRVLDRRHAARRPRPPADPLRGAARPPGAGRPRRVVPDRAGLAAAAAQGPDRADGARRPARRARRPAPAAAPPGHPRARWPRSPATGASSRCATTDGTTLALLRDDKVTVRRGGLTTARYREVMITPVGPGSPTSRRPGWTGRSSRPAPRMCRRFPRLVTRLGAPATGPTDLPLPEPFDADAPFKKFVSPAAGRCGCGGSSRPTWPSAAAT